MKLKDLAEIKQGLDIPSHLLRREKRSDGTYLQCISPDDFTDGTSYYVNQKLIRDVKGFSRKAFIFYGDYLIYKKEGEFKIYSYPNASGQTIPLKGITILTVDINILKEFLSFEKNRKYFLSELKRLETNNGSLNIESIGDIEIWTDDIKELENADLADKWGIRKPIDIKQNPIRITQKSLPFDKLIKRIQHEELLLDTEFQRRPGLWDFPTKSRLIESLIINLPIPAFYFDGSNENKWLVIDGLQRLSAVYDFINNKFALQKLDYLPELEGKLFGQLERIHQRNIEEFEVFACIVEKETPIAVKYKVFKNINTSALILKPQEIRHALNPGHPAETLKSISEKKWFKEKLLISDNDIQRMLDRELVLRFLTFQIFNYTEYKPTIVEFLDESMYALYNLPSHKSLYYENDLESILIFLYSILGENCFSKSLFDLNKKNQHSNILFELLTYGTSLLSIKRRDEILARPEEFKSDIFSHFQSKDEGFWEYEFAYTAENLKKRFEEIEILFRKHSR